MRDAAKRTSNFAASRIRAAAAAAVAAAKTAARLTLGRAIRIAVGRWRAARLYRAMSLHDVYDSFETCSFMSAVSSSSSSVELPLPLGHAKIVVPEGVVGQARVAIRAIRNGAPVWLTVLGFRAWFDESSRYGYVQKCHICTDRRSPGHPEAEAGYTMSELTAHLEGTHHGASLLCYYRGWLSPLPIDELLVRLAARDEDQDDGNGDGDGDGNGDDDGDGNGDGDGEDGGDRNGDGEGGGRVNVGGPEDRVQLMQFEG